MRTRQVLILLLFIVAVCVISLIPFSKTEGFGNKSQFANQAGIMRRIGIPNAVPTTSAATASAATTMRNQTSAPTTSGATTSGATTSGATAMRNQTSAPTTSGATTSAATTMRNQTSAPTTSAATTSGATASAATTMRNRTSAPTTMMNPTLISNTRGNLTAAPTTVAATTMGNLTAAPTTVAATTMGNLTAAPTTTAAMNTPTFSFPYSIKSNSDLINAVLFINTNSKNRESDLLYIQKIQSYISNIRTQNAATLMGELTNPNNLIDTKLFLQYINWFSSHCPLESDACSGLC